MRNLLQEKPAAKHPYLVHYISSSVLMEEVPLQKATKHCTDRPILVIAKADGIVKARCCVPKVTNLWNIPYDFSYVSIIYRNSKRKTLMPKNG